MARVMCRQLAPRVGELEANLAAVDAAIRSAVAAGAEVLVLPELVTSGYCFASREEAGSSALAADDPVFAHWQELAGDLVVVAGFAERAADGLYNSAVLLRPGATAVRYRKVHLWDTEKQWFRPGERPPPVVDTAVGRVGVMICYDLEFPEMTRSVALRGAELLAVPTNWPLVERPDGQPAPEVVIAMAAARVNRMYIACCDRSGTERGQRWTEGTTVVGPDGWPLATAGGDGVAAVAADLAATRDKRVSARNDLLGDRAPAVYP